MEVNANRSKTVSKAGWSQTDGPEYESEYELKSESMSLSKPAWEAVGWEPTPLDLVRLPHLPMAFVDMNSVDVRRDSVPRGLNRRRGGNADL